MTLSAQDTASTGTHPMRLGFIGTGDITRAMVRGLAGQGHQILISPRNATIAATLAAEVPGVSIASNEEVVAGSDVVFLCLLARVAVDVVWSRQHPLGPVAAWLLERLLARCPVAGLHARGGC